MSAPAGPYGASALHDEGEGGQLTLLAPISDIVPVQHPEVATPVYWADQVPAAVVVGDGLVRTPGPRTLVEWAPVSKPDSIPTCPLCTLVRLAEVPILLGLALATSILSARVRLAVVPSCYPIPRLVAVDKVAVVCPAV